MLVASKAYSVTRAAAVPRLLPDGLTLVKANARISMAGIVGAADLGADRRGSRRRFGPEWSLRYAFVVFVGRHDPGDPAAAAASTPARARSDRLLRGAAHRRARRRAAAASGSRASVAFALRANCGPRWLSGFLTMFMAFLLRENPIGGYAARSSCSAS